jgi:hypothetical protein
MALPSANDTCFVCAAPAESDEHVIPKWLQHRFNLWNERLVVPNGTSIPYRQLTIRACKRCNSSVFGQLEARVENNTASEDDVWCWANKIHYGLGFKEQFMEWDRKNPGKKISEVISSHDPLGTERAFLRTVNGDFTTDPKPFGSVFRFEFKSSQRFVFTHFLPSSSICIGLGMVGYVIFIRDGQTIKLNKGTQEQFEVLSAKGRVEDMLFFYANCVENFARQKMGHTIMFSNKTLVKLGPTVVHEEEPFDKERFRAICAHLGLHWVEESK